MWYGFVMNHDTIGTKFLAHGCLFANNAVAAQHVRVGKLEKLFLCGLGTSWSAVYPDIIMAPKKDLKPPQTKR